MSELKIQNLVKNFQGMDRPAVNNVNLDINSGQLVAFLDHQVAEKQQY